MAYVQDGTGYIEDLVKLSHAEPIKPVVYAATEHVAINDIEDIRSFKDLNYKFIDDETFHVCNKTSCQVCNSTDCVYPSNPLINE